MESLAVVISIAKASDKGHDSTVNCIRAKIDDQTKEIRLYGRPFRLFVCGRYIILNSILRDEQVERGSVILTVGESYFENMALKLSVSDILAQLKFDDGENFAFAHRGIKDAFPDATIQGKGISHDFPGPGEHYALVSVLSAYTVDNRICADTRLGENIDLNNRSRGGYENSISEISLPVKRPSSNDDVGDVMVIAFGIKPTQYGNYQAICEGTLLSKDSRSSHADEDLPAGTGSESKEQDCYPMSRRPRGLCLVLNNLCFKDKEDDRYGAEHDQEAIQCLFQNLSFEVEVKCDLKFYEMSQACEECAKRDHEEYDAFFCIIMSHGGDRADSVKGINGKSIDIKELTDEFRPAKCPSLALKPKVFIIQCCRGDMEDEFLTSGHCTDSTLAGCDSTLSKTTCPQETDFLLAFSTVPGYVAYRYKDYGSLFLRTLVDVITKDHSKDHLLDMLTKVTRLVAEAGSQVPAPVSTLRYKLYL